MMIKSALFGGERNGEQLVSVIRPGELSKTASHLEPCVQGFISALRPDPEYTYVLCNAMGYSEFYGANANRDWYGHNTHLDFNGLLHAWPDIGQDNAADQMKGKGWPYGYPCFYGAAVYAHHKNTDPQQLGFGDVVFAHANSKMKRIELIKRVSNAEAQRKGHTSILDRIHAGERVDVSMGAKVPFDNCSVCSDWDEIKKAWKTYDPKIHRHPGVAILAYHRQVKPIRGLAVTRADYCSCMVNTPGKVLPDGRKVFVYNDFPRFFDISFVWIGADRTARVMWHLGSSRTQGGRPTQTTNLNRLLDVLLSKTSNSKLAAMEKEVPGGIAEAVHHDAEGAPEISVRVVMRSAGPQTADTARRILSTLGSLGIVATPHEFQSLVLPTMPGGDSLAELMDSRRAVFDTSRGGIDDSFCVAPQDFDPSLAHALSPWMEERSAFAPFIHPRLGRVEPKTASQARVALRTEMLDKLAESYNGYRVSLLEQAPEMFPKAAAYLGPDIYLQEKRSSVGLAALLLGLAPVIHLVSSHLRSTRDEEQQLNAMSQFVAENPTFTSMLTIGAGLRAAMAIESAGGMGQAAKAIITAARGLI